MGVSDSQMQEEIESMKKLLQAAAAIAERLTGEGEAVEERKLDQPNFPTESAISKASILESVESIGFYLNKHRVYDPRACRAAKVLPRNALLDLLLAAECGESVIALKERQVGFSTAMASICAQHLVGGGRYDRIVYVTSTSNMLRSFQEKVTFSVVHDGRTVLMDKGLLKSGSYAVEVISCPNTLDRLYELGNLGPSSLVVLDEFCQKAYPKAVMTHPDKLIESIQRINGRPQILASLTVLDKNIQSYFEIQKRPTCSPRYIYLNLLVPSCRLPLVRWLRGGANDQVG